MPIVKCDSCSRLVHPLITVHHSEFPWNTRADCPYCGWTTGDCDSEEYALKVFTGKEKE